MVGRCRGDDVEMAGAWGRVRAGYENGKKAEKIRQRKKKEKSCEIIWKKGNFVVSLQADCYIAHCAHRRKARGETVVQGGRG